MINPQWLELPMSRTNFHGPKDVQPLKFDCSMFFCFFFSNSRRKIPNLTKSTLAKNFEYVSVAKCIKMPSKHNFFFNQKAFIYIISLLSSVVSTTANL